MSKHVDLVLSLIEKWANVTPPGGIRPEHYLMDDLQIDGDDYGMSLVPSIERHLDIKPHFREWEVSTVGELLQVVERHIGRQDGSGGCASA